MRGEDNRRWTTDDGVWERLNDCLIWSFSFDGCHPSCVIGGLLFVVCRHFYVVRSPFFLLIQINNFSCLRIMVAATAWRYFCSIIMHTKQTIALIGAAGNRGAALARNLARGNYRILLFAHGSDSLEQLVSDIRGQVPNADVEPMTCSTDACWEADIIILSIAADNYTEVSENIRPVANQKVIITMADAGVQDSDPIALLQNLLPHAKVVAAFTAITAAQLQMAFAGGPKPEVLVSGTDADAVQTTVELVQVAGCMPVAQHIQPTTAG